MVIEHDFLKSEGNPLGSMMDEYGFRVKIVNGVDWVTSQGIAVFDPTHYIPMALDDETFQQFQSSLDILSDCDYQNFGLQKYENSSETSKKTNPNGCVITPIDQYGNPIGESVASPVQTTDRFGLPLNSKTSNPDSMFHFTSEDVADLGGLSLNERKTFLDTVQSVINANGIKNSHGELLNARELRYDCVNTGDLLNGKSTVVMVEHAIADGFGLTDKQQRQLTNLLSTNRTLSQLGEKAARTSVNAAAGSYSIYLADQSGNLLPKDTIRLCAGSKSVIISVDEYKNLDRVGIANYINQN